MADLVIATQSVPSTPAAGSVVIAPETTLKRMVLKDDTGRTCTFRCGMINWSTADVVATAADTYLTGSSIAIPTGMALQAGTFVRWTVGFTKTAAGTATPSWTVRVGTAGTVADAARLTFTGPAQTASADTGYLEIVAILRNTGASGVLAGIANLSHNGNTAGIANSPSAVMQATSGGFDTTTANLIVGLSANPGTGATWTHQVVTAEMSNI